MPTSTNEITRSLDQVSLADSTHPDVHVIDVTLRDGGFINDWQFSRPFITRHLAVCEEIGVYTCEVGYVNNLMPRNDSCFLKHLMPVDIKWMRKYSKIPFSLMCDDGKYNAELLPSSQEIGVELLRVVAKYPFSENLLDDLASIKSKGYRVSLNIAACSFLNEEDVRNINGILGHSTDCVDIVYLADSFGSMLPEQVSNLFSQLNFRTKGFHGHNNMQMALANSLESIKGGALYLDASFAGMGRGGGNTHMEHLLMVLNRMNNNSRYDISLTLEYLGNFFLPEISAKHEWGYTPEQMISGYRNVHPFWLDNLKKNIFLGLDQLDIFLQTLSVEERKAYKEIDISKIESAIASSTIKKSSTNLMEKAEHQPTGVCLVISKGDFDSSILNSLHFSDSTSIFIPNEVEYPAFVHYSSCKVYRVFLRASRAHAWLKERSPMKDEFIVMPDTSLIQQTHIKLYSLPFTVAKSAPISEDGYHWTIPNCSTGTICCLLAAWMGYKKINLIGFGEQCPANEFERVLLDQDVKVHEQLERLGFTVNKNLCKRNTIHKYEG